MPIVERSKIKDEDVINAMSSYTSRSSPHLGKLEKLGSGELEGALSALDLKRQGTIEGQHILA